MTDSTPYAPRLPRMTGRDPLEAHRVATPLELLYDLSLVIAFGVAADQFARLLAGGHLGAGLLGFAFAMCTICGAWINFSWFSSAYDTDDWFYRIATMVQMIGVIMLALGLPAFFRSFDGGTHTDFRVVVVGYVVMRIALVAQWLRVSVQAPAHRRTALTYVRWVSLAQIGWVTVAVLELPLVPTVALAAALSTVEFGIPLFAERVAGGTPWHPHHIAERYGLLAIIALGEGVVGTVTTVSAILQHQGWSVEAIAVIIAGTGLTFGMWWTYFTLPAGTLLTRRRNKWFVWGYGHIVVYASIAAMGAGLHVAALVVEGATSIGTVGAILAVSIPVAIYSVTLFASYSYLFEEWNPLHLALVSGTILMLAIGVGLAAAGAPLGLCLIVVTLSPAIVIVGFETVGHRHQLAALNHLEGQTTAS